MTKTVNTCLTVFPFVIIYTDPTLKSFSRWSHNPPPNQQQNAESIFINHPARVYLFIVWSHEIKGSNDKRDIPLPGTFFLLVFLKK